MYPEVPRTYHAGARGTFMDEHHHNLYFKDIDYNREPSFRWADVEHTFVTAMKPRLKSQRAGGIEKLRWAWQQELWCARRSSQLRSFTPPDLPAQFIFFGRSMRLLLFALLSRAAGEITWHVGSTGQSCDVTCTSLNPSKSCALDSFASAVGSSNFNNVVHIPHIPCPPSPIDTLKWHDETVWPGMQISHISLRPTETTSPTSLSVAEAPVRV